MENIEHGPAKKRLDPPCRKDFETEEEYKAACEDFEEACNQLRRDFDKRMEKSRAKFKQECEEMHLASKKIHLPSPEPQNRARHYIHTFGVLPCVKAILNTTAGLKGIRQIAEAEVA